MLRPSQIRLRAGGRDFTLLHLRPMTEVESSCDGHEANGRQEIGKRLQEARKQAGLSQLDVERRLGSGFATRSITRWECGKAEPSYGKIEEMAKLYDVSPAWIVDHRKVKERLEPGMVAVDTVRFAFLRELVARGGSIDDVPRHMISKPGFNCMVRIPEKLELVDPEEARRLDEEVQQLWAQLKRTK